MKEKVLALRPDAESLCPLTLEGSWQIIAEAYGPKTYVMRNMERRYQLGKGKTEAEAWADAALNCGVDISLYDFLVACGVEIGNHESDLQFPINHQTARILSKYPQKASIAERFKNQIDGTFWFDVPFAYLPFWESKQRLARALGRS